MQTGVNVGTDAITGTLNKVTDFTQFSGTVGEQSGNYLVINVTTEPADSVTTKIELVGGTATSVKKSGNSYVIRITDKNAQSVKITSSKSGYQTAIKTYSLKGLTLNS